MRYRNGMKFVLQSDSQINVVRACSAEAVDVRGHELRSSAIVTAERIVPDWSARSVDTLTPADVRAVLALEPEVIILGTGAEQIFPPPAVADTALSAGVGFEAMATRAACRTYNVLVQEGRRVALALVMPKEPDGKLRDGTGGSAP
jgi:uncharacterized protein